MQNNNQYQLKNLIIKKTQIKRLKHLGIAGLLAGVLALVLGSCFLPPENAGGGLILSSESLSPSGSRGSRSSRSQRQGRLCEDDSRCEDVCEDVYDDKGDSENDGKIRACLELSYTTALAFEDLLEFITTEISSSNLRSIKERTWTKFLDVSIAPWVEAAGDASSSESKTLLAWIAENSRIAQGIVEAYKNYEVGFDQFEGMEELLDSHGCDKEITGNKNFIQIACTEGNNPAMQMHEYVCQATPSCGSYSRSADFPSVSVDQNLFDTAVAIHGLIYLCPLNGGAVDTTTKTAIEACVDSCSDADKTNIKDSPIGEPITVTCLDNCKTENSATCIAYRGGGSGVFQATDKVLTNHHVVSLSQEARLTNNKGKPVPSSPTHFIFSPVGVVETHGGSTEIIDSDDITWYDTASDIALLTLDNSISEARPAQLGSLADLEVLDTLITIGQPAGLRWIISQGQLTSKNPRVRNCRHCIAHSIPIGVGNSGGPIFDKDGKLVGLIALISQGYDNLSFGPHIDRIKYLLDHDGTGDVTSN